MLANELAVALGPRGWNVLHPSVDGFHHPRERRYRKGKYSAIGYYEDAHDYQAVIGCLLGPLSGDVFPVLIRQIAYDLYTNRPVAAAPVSVGVDSVLLFEGLFLFRKELNAYWDFRILLDIDSGNRLVASSDGTRQGSPQRISFGESTKSDMNGLGRSTLRKRTPNLRRTLSLTTAILSPSSAVEANRYPWSRLSRWALLVSAGRYCRFASRKRLSH